MNRQILKHFLVYLPLMLAGNACLGQFTEMTPVEGRMKGKVDSVVFANFNIVKNGTAEAREFNDKVAYIYNLQGLLIEERASDEETDPRPFRTVYIYDTKGYRSQVLDYSRKGVLRRKENYTFDPLKRLVELRAAGIVTTKILLDNAGNVMETTNYHDYPTPFSTFRYKYNHNGLCMESVQTWSKSPDMQKIVYEYDANHNLIKETIHNNRKLLSTYTHTYSKYDKMQNWLVQHTYRNGKLDGVTERTIAYR